METASEALDFERAAIYRDRLAALSAIQGHQGINPRSLEEADVFAVHQDGGFTCVEVFFFRTGQNWGNRAYFPKADRSLSAGEVLGAFLAQFYDDKPCPRCILLSQEIEERALLAEALSHQERAQGRDRRAAARRAQGTGRSCARQCARSAGAQARGHLLAAPAAGGARRNLRPVAAAAAHRGLRQQPHPGIERGRRHDRRRTRGLSEEPVPQVQHPLRRSHARRRFRHDARGAHPPLQAAARRGAAGQRHDAERWCRCCRPRCDRAAHSVTLSTLSVTLSPCESGWRGPQVRAG